MILTAQRDSQKVFQILLLLKPAGQRTRPSHRQGQDSLLANLSKNVSCQAEVKESLPNPNTSGGPRQGCILCTHNQGPPSTPVCMIGSHVEQTVGISLILKDLSFHLQEYPYQ